MNTRPRTSCASVVRAYPVYADSRLGGECIYCGAPPETREQVPPRVLLDPPYPDNLFVVEACLSCNSSYSLDEEYLACLLEVVTCGTTNAAKLGRPSVAATLRRQPLLTARINASVDRVDGRFAVHPEQARVERVIEKIARGLAVFENAEPVRDAVAEVRYTPVHELEADALERFLALAAPSVLPEVGSRMLQRLVITYGVVAKRLAARAARPLQLRDRDPRERYARQDDYRRSDRC
jgi:hypothetical protein